MPKEAMPETEFIDAEGDWGSGKEQDFSFRYIVMVSLLKLSAKAGVEFRGGYWMNKTKTDKTGNVSIEKTYIPDSREEYSNSVNFMHDMMLSHFDKEMMAKSKIINDKLKDLLKKTLSKTSAHEQDILGTDLEDTALLGSDDYDGNDRRIIEMYKFAKLKLERELFQELCRFMHRWHYGEVQGIIDG